MVVLGAHKHVMHVGSLVLCLCLNSKSASMALAGSTDSGHSSLKCKLVRKYFKFCLN